MSAPRHTPLELIARLVAFETVSADSNLALIHFVRDYLAAHGIESRLSFDPDGAKANLLAAIGPMRPGGIVLSGHTDVVPVAGQPWDSDPFTVVERNGGLYGRGTADMKSFLAAALALVPELKAAALRVPIYLALSYDEEIGCLGVGGLLADLAAHLPRPALAIVGEPTLMQVVNRHKGVYAFETVIAGRDVHSSATHRGVSAISHAGEVIGWLNRLAETFRTEGPFDESFDPPYTTVNIGNISGGAAINIVARECRLNWEFRPVPGVDPESIRQRLEAFIAEAPLPRMRRVAPEAGITTRRLCAVPPLAPEADSPAEPLVRLLTGANRADGAAFASEGGLFQAAGVPAVLCGPGSIEQAHQPNEFIAVAQVEACVAFLRRLLAWASER